MITGIVYESYKKTISNNGSEKMTVLSGEDEDNLFEERSDDNIDNVSPTIFFRNTMSDFIYPHAEIIATTKDTIKLESIDEPDEISMWYEDKMKSSNFNIKTFIKTSSNDDIVNKMVGNNENFQISIDIAKPSKSDLVGIEISLKLQQ